VEPTVFSAKCNNFSSQRNSKAHLVRKFTIKKKKRCGPLLSLIYLDGTMCVIQIPINYESTANQTNRKVKDLLENKTAKKKIK